MDSASEGSTRKFEMTPNEVAANAVVYAAMMCFTRNQSGVCTRAEAFQNFPQIEQGAIWPAVEALGELGVFILRDDKICLTNVTEPFLAAFHDISTMNIETADQIREKNPGFAALIKVINSDARFAISEDLWRRDVKSRNYPSKEPGRLKYYASLITLGVIVIWGVMVMLSHR